MSLKTSSSFAAALVGAAHQVACGTLGSAALGSSGLRFRCKHDPAGGADPWASGTEFLNIGMAGPLFVDPDTGDMKLGAMSGATVRNAANLATGTAAWRIEGNSHYIEGTLGLSGSGRHLIVSGSPTATTGFAIAGAIIRPRPDLPINGNSVAVGGKLTDITFQNTTGSPLADQIITFAHVFKKGAMPASGAAVSLVGSSTLPAQMDVKATHSDGSVRHAVISAVLPSLAASTSATYDIQRVTASAATPATPADFAAMDAVVSVVHDGTTYSASLATLLAASKTDWLSGNIASEWHVNGSLKTSGGVAHASLTARFNARAYKGKGRARIDVIVENGATAIGSATPIKHVVYDLSITVGGAQVYAKSAVAHLPYARFRKTYWYGGAAPTVHVRHNTAYLMATKAVPNYDPALIGAMNASQETTYDTNQTANGDIFQNGIALAYMPNTGGRADIGLLPGWDAMYLLGMSEKMRRVCLKQSDLMGSWSVHKRDAATGQPVSAIDTQTLNVSPEQTYAITNITSASPPVVTCSTPHKFVNGMMVYITNVIGDMASDPTGIHPERAVNFSKVVVANCTATTFELVGKDLTTKTYGGGGTFAAYNDKEYEEAHCPAVGYLAYMLSGDHYHLEEMQFYGAAVGKGHYLNGRQTRTQAWGMRDFAHVAYLAPDGDRLKTHFAQLLSMNITDYTTRYTTGASANALGAIIGGSSWSDPDSTGLVIRSWQDDFVTSAFGRVLELGFSDAATMFTFKAKFPVSRMNYCRMLSSAYNFKLRPAQGSPLYTTIEQVFAATYPPDYPQAGNNLLAQVFDSAAMGAQATNIVAGDTPVIQNSMTGYAASAQGYGADMQPALAYAATHGATGAAAAWSRYEGRAVKQNDYSSLPQFAIVPRV